MKYALIAHNVKKQKLHIGSQYNSEAVFYACFEYIKTVYIFKR